MSWTYALLTPDGVLTGMTRTLLQKAEALELKPVCSLLIALDQPTMSRVYDHDSPPRENPLVEEWIEMFRGFYPIGPSYLVIFHLTGEGACERLKAVKGNTWPSQAASGTIRSFSENVVLNSMHSPDTECDAAVELEFLLGRSRSLSAVEECRRLDSVGVIDQQTDVADVDWIMLPIPTCEGVYATSFPIVVVKYLSRMLHAAAIDRAPVIRERQLLDPLRSELVFLHESLVADRQAGAHVGSDGVSRCCFAMSELAKRDRVIEPLWRPCLETLCRMLSGSLVTPLAVRELEQRFYISPLERVVLQTTAYALAAAE